ncbi:hypothetical protein C819_01981 [Lachnospiraceae bacterium 10-1]|nr:hypothetical protein C819_01981 [Lachnospiraceae bacterium 10-1]
MAREMKDSGIEWIGEIPKEWKLVPIKYIASYNDETLSENTNSEYEFDYIEIGSVEYGKGVTQVEHMKYKNAPSRARRIVKKNDIIVSTVRTYLRAVAIIQDSANMQIASTGFVVIRAKKINYEYLRYAILSESFICMVEAYSTGISYPAINARVVVGFKIPFPKNQQQKKIAHFLNAQCTELDDILEKTRASIEEYKKLKQAVITQVVTKGVRGNREMKDSQSIWFGQIPSDWEMRKIKYIFKIQKDIAGEEGHTVLSITQKGIKPKDLSKNEGQLAENYSNYQLVHIGDFAMNHMDLLTGWVDISKYEGVTSPDYRVFELIDKDNYCSQYYLYLMQMCYTNRIFYGLGQGVSGLGRWRLQADKFLNFSITVPSYEEQQEIANYLDKKCSAIDELIAKKEQYLSEIENYKKTLIYEYVTGKKEVPQNC